ncbi:6-pyruvoyl tetrahydrobiopterin synthase-like [Diadema setosum]|uniref:6-pyruvoyl tetrahydrobiopterin synthase-like n=1 Tax=Diadema setosum TaxID=31175 RepID=UPI003B3B2229
MCDEKKTPIAYLTRIEKISSCHRLHSPALSDEENAALYGKCNNLHGHGHNYTVEVTLRGKVDPVTGMIINIADLKEYMKVGFIDLLDHKNLDKDVEYFKTKVSTVENIACFIWERMTLCLPDPTLLHEVKVHETDKNIAVYRGE